MPTVTIEVRRSYPPDEEAGLIDAVHGAMVEGLQTPAWDRYIRFIAHAPERFTVAPGQSDRFTLVTLDAFAGRPLEAKKRFYAAAVRNLAALGVPPDEVVIVLREQPAENWGVRGGVPASELALAAHLNPQAA